MQKQRMPVCWANRSISHLFEKIIDSSTYFSFNYYKCIQNQIEIFVINKEIKNKLKILLT